MIPFNKPYVPEESMKYVTDVLRGNFQQGDGPFTREVSSKLSQLVGGGHVLLTPSCTHALEMASLLLDLGPGDEVILPSYTFTSAAIAVVQFGAIPIFVDIEKDSKCIDSSKIEAAITPKTKAISWVNYAGMTPDIYEIQRIAKANNLFLIEDNAHGLGGEYKGKPLGSFGDFATQSFHATKNFQCGEGGALIINNLKFLERANIIREKGTDRSKFFAGQVEKYQWVDKGSSYLLAEALAAILLGQIENFSIIQNRRAEIWQRYHSNIFGVTKLSPQQVQQKKAAHMYYLEIAQQEYRQEIIKVMQEDGIQTVFHYQPLDKSIGGARFGSSTGETTISEGFSNSILRLPIWYGLKNEEIDFISDKIKQHTKELK